MITLASTQLAAPNGSLDAASEVPLFYQLNILLRDAILSGHYRPGDRMPSEAELCATYGISRTTVRYALDRLTAEGYVTRLHGKGTFVTVPTPKWGLSMDPSWARAMRARGIAPEVQSLLVERRPATSELREYLTLASDTVIYLRRLVLGNGEPWAVSEQYVDSALGLPDDLLAGGIIADLLAKHLNARVSESICLFLEPRLIGEEEAALLGVPPASAGLYVARQVKDNLVRAVLYSESLFRGDRCRLLFSSV